VYTHPGEYWGFEKQITDGKVVVKPRKLEEGEQYRDPVPAPDQSVEFLVEDWFAQSYKIMHYARNITDDKGKEHRLDIEWSGHFETSKRRLFFVKKRRYVHYIKVTVDGKRLFYIDDYVDQGAYNYEDFFRLGTKKYRLNFVMQSNLDS